MSASTTIPKATIRRWTWRHYTVLAAIILALVTALFVGYRLGGATTSGSDTTQELVPLPFKDGFVPAQPM